MNPVLLNVDRTNRHGDCVAERRLQKDAGMFASVALIPEERNV